MEHQKPKKEKHEFTKNHIPDYEQLFQESAGDGQKKKSSGVYRRLIRQHYGGLLLSTVLFIIKNSPIYVIPIVTAEVINAVADGGADASRKLFIYAILLAVLLFQNIPTHVLYSKYTDRMLRTISAGFRNTLVKKLQHLSLTYHKEIESGRIQSKFLRDIDAIEFLNTHFVKSVIPAIIGILVSIGVAISKSLTVTLFFAIMIPVNVSVVYFFRHSMSDSNRKFRAENENISAKISSMIDMIPVTKAHGLENTEIAVLEKNIQKLRDQGLILDRVNAYFGSVSWVVSQVMSAICLFFTAFLAWNGNIDVGDIVLYQTYFSSISNNLQGLINIYPNLAKGVDSIQSASEIILSNDIENNSGKIPLRFVHGTVQFEHVSYRYPNAERDMIKDFSLSVEPGECVAFVGASGSGKTTIMNMIIGFLKPTQGTLKIDGKPIDALNLTNYRQFLSVVPQNSILFAGSIRENIMYGLTDISEERLQEVVHLANIDEFTNQLPLGLDTPVGENGANLSGGQKQRIAIARALIRSPKILILDEATSALDNISEYHVQSAINHLIQGKTTFIVAHRLSTIRNADKIVVMDGGRCVECGTFEELMAKKGTFYQLKSLNDNVSSASYMD
ncbi:MAG: ABC transporter ATP-binding protein [Clostridia bacterium]|nr:ABC transporter ATP-binding protein [Clostridia bacterium]